MKLLVDMFACQTYSRFRGIGRYSLSLVSEMAKSRGTNEMVLLADALYPEGFEELRQNFIRLLPSENLLPYHHEPFQRNYLNNIESLSMIAETLIEQAYQVASPDMVLTPSLFDDWGGGEQGKVPLQDKNFTNHQRAVILYDIIPYIFRKQYLDPDPPIRDWYLKRLEMLKGFDLLLAISESTRQDVINYLGIDPNRVVNISGAASSHIRKLELSDDKKQSFLNRFGISRPFVLYIGGNDFRKNMEGALRVFAHLPREIITSHQLVLNDVGDEAVFRNKARTLGLEDENLVIARRTTDEELSALYNLCKLFIFPSLYEGFGLPVLEAMTCGAPVLASNNSSLPEVVGRADALFDIADDQAVADKINQVLTDNAFRTELAAYGLERVKQFSWHASAKRAWDAIESSQKEKKSGAHPKIPEFSPQKSLRIAYVSPLPPQKSGIANYSSTLLRYLKSYFEIDLFVEPGLDVSDVFLKGNFSIHPWTELPNRRDNYDTIIYHMGNSEFHIPMLPLLQDVPGIVVNHDFFMSNLPFVKAVKSGERGIFLAEVDYNHGLRGVIDYMKLGIESARWAWPMNWKVLKYAQEIIVHSEHHRELIEKFYTYGWKPNLRVIKHLRESAPIISNSQKRALRKKLGLDPAAFIYCSFGFMAPTKLNNLTILTFSHILSEIQDNIMLVFVGDLDGGEYGLETLKIIQDLKLTKKVLITGYVSKEEYEKYLGCADVAIQLRTDSRGETSGALLDCLAYGLPVIINAHGSMNDYSEKDVVKLLSEPSTEELALAMIHLRTDEPYRLEKGRRARNLIIEQHDPKKIAAAYAEAIIGAVQINEQKIFAPLVDSIQELGSPDELVQSSARYAAANSNLRCQPHILVDVTPLENLMVESNEQYNISEFVKKLFTMSDKSIQVELIQVNDGQLLRACRFAEKTFELPNQSLGDPKPIHIQPGDILLMLDDLLETPFQSSTVFDKVRQKGGKIITILHSFSASLLDTPAIESDFFICCSSKPAEEAFALIKNISVFLQRPLDILFPCPEQEALQNDKNTLHNNFQVELSERDGLMRMVKVYAPAWNDGIGWIQALLEGRFIHIQHPNLNDDGSVLQKENGIELGELIENQPQVENENTFETAKKDRIAPNNEIFYAKMAGEQTPLVSCIIATPNSKEFSIIVQEDAGDGISAAILANNYELPHHYHMLFDLVPPHGNVLDLGAHIGTFSLMAASDGYNVVSVEASRKNAALLNESIRKNGFNNVQLFQAAISDREGSVEFIQNGPHGMISNKNVISDIRRITVPTITVDHLFTQIGWQKVNLIKMDIEGSEVNAIKGMTRLLTMEEAPVLLFESNGHTLNLFGVTPQDLFLALETTGYECYHFYNGRLFPINSKDVQLECVADCVAAKILPENFNKKWEIASPMSRENKIELALEQLTHFNKDVRAYTGRTLEQVDETILRDARLTRALDDSKNDPIEAVRKSVSWWTGRKSSL